MSTYAIGDVQGCFDTLVALLAKLPLTPSDRLWFVGDLVNRGPKSLDTLRLIKGLGSQAVCVLGNHDIHLIRRFLGLVAAKKRDTLDEVLRAPDAKELIDWLTQRPLLHREGPYTMVHAGIHPQWTVTDATEAARRIETQLQDPAQIVPLLKPHEFTADLKVLTTLRTCAADGSLCKFNGSPEDAPKGCFPWFSHPSRRSRGEQIVFGHWAALGLRRGADYLALDSGCVWGRKLTAVCLEDGRVFDEPTHEQTDPDDD